MKISDFVVSAAKLLGDSVESWTTLQENPEIHQLQETIKQRQAELETVKVEIKTLPPMEKMLRVKRSKELQQEIESYRVKVTELEDSIQPLVSEALELSTAVDSQFKILQEYGVFAQEKATEVSSAVLQELVEKEKAADDIMHSLNTQFAAFAKKLRPTEN